MHIQDKSVDWQNSVKLCKYILIKSWLTLSARFLTTVEVILKYADFLWNRIICCIVIMFIKGDAFLVA